MANAGASIDAFLRLDASEFDKSLNNVSATVTKFKESMLDIGKNSKDFTLGLQNTSRAITKLMESMEKLDGVDSKAITKFKNLATALQNIATAAQRMSVDVQRGSVGMEMLSTVIDIFNTGVSSAEVHLKATNAQLQALARNSREVTNSQNSTTQSTRQFSSEANAMENNLRRMKNELNMMALAVQKSQYSFNDFRTNVRYAFQDLANLQSAVQPLARIQEQIRLVKDQAKLMGAEFQRSRTELLNFANGGVEAFNKVRAGIASALEGTSSIINNQSGHFARLKSEIDQVSNSYRMLRLNAEGENVTLEKSSLALEKNSAEMMKNAEAKLRAMGYNGQLSSSEQRLANAEQQVSNSANREASSIQRANASMNQGVGSANRLTTATKGLGRAMSSLRMMGSMVGSMLAYNFAHKLLVATGETIHAKSEMEGYFKMLNFGQGEINSFNQALDRTVAQFQRVNKYSLGETISSIGVEFNLTTQEMEKAMKVTSMITSEYLRAGRNANEASLAVKDVLQGQFQRLSRETGVKGEQLKEAGWSGDPTDVMSLLDALEKVGMSRNWDVFAEKANSLNDILTILQNRFGEWSADMVNVVQPSIVGAFNAIMSVAQGFANVLGGFWQWLNTDGWGQTAVKIGAIGTALLTTSQMLLMYRANVGLVEASQLGLQKSIASVILGLKGQEVAEVGVRNSIMAKILGVKAETIAEQGVTGAIAQKITSLQASTVQQEANSVATGVNTTAQQLSTSTTQGLTVAKEMETAQEEVNTAMKELNTAETLKQEGANTGLIASLYMLGTAELYDAEATGTLATAWGVLNGVFSLSPIGWLTLAILGLSTAVYTLTGGFDSMWGSLQNATKAVDDASSATKPYRDYVEQTNRELEEAKEKYGENSVVVQALSEKYDRAKDSLDRYYQKLQEATSQHGKLNEELSVTSAKMDEIMRSELGDFGYGEAELDEMTTGISELSLLQDHDYTALQKHSAMLGNFEDAVHSFAQTAGNDTEAIQNFGKTYYDFINYSDKANTADNWWDWATNSAMAGVSGMSLDIQKFLKGDWSKRAGTPDTDILKAIVGDDFYSDPAGKIGEWWGGVSKSFGDAFNNLDWGAFGDIGGRISQWFSDIGSSLGDSWNTLTEMFDNNIKQPIMDWWNGFTSFEWLGSLTNFDLIGKFFDLIFPKGVSASDGSSDHPSFMEDLSALLGFDIQAWIDSFMGTLGIDLSGFDILGTLTNFLFGTGDGTGGLEWAMNFINTNIITPITETWSTFISDPIAFIGDMGFTVTGFLDSLFGTDIFSQTWAWVNQSIIQPFGTAIYNGIMSIPILSDVLTMLGFTDQAQPTSSEKGQMLARAFEQKVREIVGNIPILGDVLRFLGVIPQANPTASSNGQGVGTSVKDGLKNGINGIADIVRTEMGNVVNAISEKAGEAYATAQDIGNRIVNGIKDAMDMHSPSIISRELMPQEFGTYIPEAIRSNGDLAYQSAQYYGQQITDGISSVNTDSLNLDTAIGNYETDAQMIATSSQMMGMETSTAFNDMSLAVNTTTSTMSSNVGSTYSQMQQKQSSSLQSMKTQNQTAYHEMYLKSNQSLIQMRDSTSNITNQMISAWSHMKNQLVATANQLRSESTSHFNRLSDTIGSFYRKIQNPSNWGAGGGSSIGVRGARNPSVGRSIVSSIRTRGATHHGAGGSSASPYTRGGKTMTLRALKNMICPDGSCDIFDGYDLSQKVNVDDFLSSIGGEHGFGWSGWNKTHFNYIKTKSDEWDMKSPRINLAGGIDTNTNFKVKDFENGTPQISFSSFQSMAEAIFNAIPYRFYYDSAWKGSWLGALQAGACNCSDGADALIAFANACGFSGYKQHGTWRNSNGQSFGHFWAVINGHKMDTTGWQNLRTWTPSNSAGSPMVRRASHSSMNTNDRPINVTININEPVYGVDDLDTKIQDSVNKGLQREFNDPYTVAL